MALDGITVAALANELNTKISNGRISKITQPENDELMLLIKTSASSYRLSLSADASLPFVYLTEENKPAPMTAPAFCMLLRKHLSGGRITAIRQPSLERIIDIHVEHYNEMGDLCNHILTIELMGKHSNIIFRNEDGMIIDSIKHVSSLMSSVREVLPGRSYFIPDTGSKLNPFETDIDTFIDNLTARSLPLVKALYTTFTGFSPVMSEAIIYEAALDSSLPSASFTRNDMEALWRRFDELMNKIKAHDFAPRIFTDDKGNPFEFAAVDMPMFSDSTVEVNDSISAILEGYYKRRSILTRSRQKTADLRRIVQTLLERNVKKYDLQVKQLKDTEKMDQFRLYGELLQTYAYTATPQAKSVEVENYYDNTMITIPLDPLKTAMENSQHYFTKYNKLKRTKEAVTKQLTDTEAEIEHLRSIATSLDIVVNESDLAEIKEELCDYGYIRHRSDKGKKKPVRSKPMHFISSDGFHIYVGKNNYQNDVLTFKMAGNKDWWFHAKKMPGSHVIVRTEGNELPDSTFEEAASLAAYYSSGRTMDKVEVDYVQKKEVKKPTGAKPGFVVYYTNYSMMAIPKNAENMKEEP